MNWQRNQCIILGKEVNEIDASTKRNYKQTLRFNSDLQLLSKKEEFIFPQSRSTLHTFKLDKTGRMIEDTLKSIDEKNKEVTVLAVTKWIFDDQKNKAYSITSKTDKNGTPLKQGKATMTVFFNTSRTNKKHKPLLACYLEDFILNDSN